MQNTPYAAQQQQVNKFLEATRRLGAQMDQDQGTTRVIYDTTGLGAGRTNFDFFDQVTSKTYPATNLDQNRFQPGEGMVIKEIAFTDLQGALDFSSALSFAVVSFFIGNNRVIKDLPLSAFSTIAALNPLNYPCGLAVSEEEPSQDIPTTIRLRTNLVIPPQIQFKATLRLPFTPVGSVNIKMSVKGYGKLFNPGQNY
jgi:hypothetical protein